MFCDFAPEFWCSTRLAEKDLTKGYLVLYRFNLNHMFFSGFSLCEFHFGMFAFMKFQINIEGYLNAYAYPYVYLYWYLEKILCNKIKYRKTEIIMSYLYLAFDNIILRSLLFSIETKYIRWSLIYFNLSGMYCKKASSFSFII